MLIFLKGAIFVNIIFGKQVFKVLNFADGAFEKSNGSSSYK